jgi:16S rRNA G966 N2-methylase RsmD
MKEPLVKNKQRFVNGEIHRWYTTVLGYSDRLVCELLDDWNLSENAKVLDPFCGSGTTLVECKKRGMYAVGVDANPSAWFASRVKTNWSIEPEKVLQNLEIIRQQLQTRHLSLKRTTENSTYQYLLQSGMIERGWISDVPLRRAIVIKNLIDDLGTSAEHKNLLLLALINIVVGSASNIKFGPEAYCAEIKLDYDVFESFENHVGRMVEDLTTARSCAFPKSKVLFGDSRSVETRNAILSTGKVDAVICSPPYPTEHDYTRNARLELAFLGYVHDADSLRLIKRTMLRSHTKGIYKSDTDAKLVESMVRINRLARVISREAASKEHGFARLYSEVVKQYFGGMKRHFYKMKQVVKKGGLCAYVVGDQASYLRIPIPTASILAEIAEDVGLRVVKIQKWRNKWSTATASMSKENILLLENI